MKFERAWIIATERKPPQALAHQYEEQQVNRFRPGSVDSTKSTQFRAGRFELATLAR